MDPVSDFSMPLYFSPCPHLHITTVSVGTRRFVHSEVWDNIEDKLLCLDCGEYVTEGEVRARWNGTDYFDDNLPKEEPDYGDF